MPIVVWSNGACSADGTSAVNFLKEIASYGFLVISNGNPGGGGSSSSSWLTQSIDWAVAENSRSQSALYNRLDTSKIGVAGFSCGGIEAYAVSGDPRVTTTGIFSSGLLNDADDYQLRRLDHPIVYIIGGPSDIAYANAMDDWGKLPAGLPAFMGNLNVGHGGTYGQTNGGEFGRAAQLWFRWQLKGDTTAGRAFVGQNCALCGNGGRPSRRTSRSAPTPRPRPRHPDPDPHADRDSDAHPDAHPHAGHLRVQRDVHGVRPVARRLRRERRGDRALRGHRVDRAADTAQRRHGRSGVERGPDGQRGIAQRRQRGLERSARCRAEHVVRVPGHGHRGRRHRDLRGRLICPLDRRCGGPTRSAAPPAGQKSQTTSSVSGTTIHAVTSTTTQVRGCPQGSGGGGGCTMMTGCGAGGGGGGGGGGGFMSAPHRTHSAAFGTFSSAHTGHASVAGVAVPEAPGARRRASSVRPSTPAAATDGRAQNSG